MKKELERIGLSEITVKAWRGHLNLIREKLRDAERNSKEVERYYDDGIVGKKKSANENNDPALILSFGSIRVLGQLYFVLENIFDGHKHLKDYRMVVWSEAKRDEQRVVLNLGFWCLNPAVVFGPMIAQARSVILSSGTLSPMETFATELATGFEQKLEALHVIDSQKQLWAGAFSFGPSASLELRGTFGELEKFQFQDDIGKSILDICTVVPYGVLCFVPSYSFLDKLVKRMRVTGVYDSISQKKEVFIEPRAGGAKDFEKIIKRYYQSIQKVQENPPRNAISRNGALFFAVFRGKVSEGLDFVDENARAVISIGIPYPSIKDEKIVLKREYNDKRAADGQEKLLNGQQWYEKQAFRAINQALGRCIRHKDDWGAIILLESRFHQARNVEQLSRWIRPCIKPYKDYQLGLTSLRAFMKEKYPQGMVPINTNHDSKQDVDGNSESSSSDSELDIYE